MPRAIEFFFDYGSPYSYIANAVLPELARRHAAELVYRPMLLGAVFKDRQSIADDESVAAKLRRARVRRTAALSTAWRSRQPALPIKRSR